MLLQHLDIIVAVHTPMVEDVARAMNIYLTLVETELVTIVSMNFDPITVIHSRPEMSTIF